MVEYKKQHYLPQFYFGYFSEDGISIYKFDVTSEIIKKKGYKNLCAESYFYANISDYEQGLHELEIKFNDAILKLIEEKDLKKLNMEEYIFLIYFMCFQHARTKKEKMRLEEELDIFAKSQLKKIYNDRFAELKEVDFSQKHLQYLNRCKIGATGLGSSSFAHMVSLSLN